MANRTQTLDDQGKVVIGEYKATPPSYADGAVVVPQFTSSGLQKTQSAVDASASVGATPLFDADGDNSAQQVKSSAGAVYAIEVSNPNAADAYLQLFDVANASVTVGTTTPNLSFLVPAGDGTTDIAIGDPLGAFTTAKIAMKAAAGDMAFAVALEAYTTDDSSGVIDALLIVPRKI